MWDNQTPGHCYHAERISTPTSDHPTVDLIYISIISLYLVYTVIHSLFFCDYSVTNETDEMWKQIFKSIRPNLRRNSMSIESARRADYGERIKQSFDRVPRTHFTMLLLFSMAQYPIHVYILYALRASNQRYITGDSENRWTFGQIIAVVLLASTVIECIYAMCGKSNRIWETTVLQVHLL